MPLPPKVKAGCGAAILFLAGCLSGVVFVFLLLIFLVPRSEGCKKNDSKDFLAKHLSKRLKLTDEQQQALRPGFNQFLDKRWDLRSDYLKKDRTILEDYGDSVRPELTPDQQTRLEKILERWWNEKRRMVSE